MRNIPVFLRKSITIYVQNYLALALTWRAITVVFPKKVFRPNTITTKLRKPWQ